MGDLNIIPDFSAEVAAHRESKKSKRATGIEVVEANAGLWEGYAIAGAEFEHAAARITEIHNNGLEDDRQVKVATVKRAFQQKHGGWKEFVKRTKLGSVSIALHQENQSATAVSKPSVGLSDNRPVGGRIFGESRP